MVTVLEEYPKKETSLESKVNSGAVYIPTRDGLVARFHPSVYSKLKQEGVVHDGEQLLYGGTVDYSPGGHDVSSEPDSDYELPEDSRFQLVEHQNNQKY